MDLPSPPKDLFPQEPPESHLLPCQHCPLLITSHLTLLNLNLLSPTQLYPKSLPREVTIITTMGIIIITTIPSQHSQQVQGQARL